MAEFTIHTLESAPEESKPLLENSIKSAGFIPGLHGVFAEAPGLLEAYQLVGRLFQNSSFNKEEITVIWQTINVEHKCHYCVPAHTRIANAMKVDPEITEALRNKTALPSEKLQVLHETTLAMVRSRGQPTDAEIKAFYAAGYSQRQLLEIVLGIAHKVMSNYTNHLAKTPLDKSAEPYAWQG